MAAQAVALALAVIVGTAGGAAPNAPRQGTASERAPRFHGTSAPLDPATRSRISADRDRVARSLVRCDELIGKTRGEVREMLGHSRGPAKAQRYGTGWTDDALGSSYRFLIVNYDEDNRVRRAHLTPLITD